MRRQGLASARAPEHPERGSEAARQHPLGNGGAHPRLEGVRALLRSTRAHIAARTDSATLSDGALRRSNVQLTVAHFVSNMHITRSLDVD